MNELYENVARACHEQGISVSALCERASVSPGILSDLKRGRKKSVSAGTLAKLARALDVSTDELLGVEQPEPPNELNPDDLIACYGEVYRYLDERDRHDMIAFMRIRAEMNKHNEKV